LRLCDDSVQRGSEPGDKGDDRVIRIIDLDRCSFGSMCET